MSWPQSVIDRIRRLQAVQRQLKDTFVGRDEAVELLTLATLCREHLLILGPPGTAKTDLITRYADLVEVRGFHYLLSRFTEPSELFGPLDLAEFQKGDFKIHTKAMLPEAEIAFLDEVFQGSSAILNSLLTLVNERIFHNGAVRQPVPLVTLIGASNGLPDDAGLSAFADRFLLRLRVDPLGNEKLNGLIDIGWELEQSRIEDLWNASAGQTSKVIGTLKGGDLLELYRRLGEVKLEPVKPNYASVIRDLRVEGVELTDRRVVRGLKLVAAAALLRGATEAGPDDLWPLRHVWSRMNQAEAIATVVNPHLSQAAAGRKDGARPIAEILKDLEILTSQAPAVRGEVALGAHLMALNRLRREVLRNHRPDTAARQRAEDAIRQTLSQLEQRNVQD